MTFAVIGIVVGAIVGRSRHRGDRPAFWAAVLRWFLIIGIGLGFAYDFVMHSVFGSFTAETIGWPQSPFQLELAFASLGFALIAFLAASRQATLMFTLAAIPSSSVSVIKASTQVDPGRVCREKVNRRHSCTPI